jgi:hypothetical protein
MANPRFEDFTPQGSGSAAAPAGAFGTRVAPVANIPIWDRNAAVASVAPMQPQASGVAWQDAIDMMGGGISQGTQNYIRDRAAAMGVNLGAGSNDWVTSNALIGEVGASEARMKQGLDAYNALLSGTQALVSDPTAANTTNQANQQWNNTQAAAPDPAAVAAYQKNLFDEYIKTLSQSYKNTTSPAGGAAPRPNILHPTGVQLAQFGM